jgi:hypothetical protein
VLSGNDLNLLGDKPMLVELELTAQQPDRQNPNTGDIIKGRGPQNRVIQRKAATAENVALHINGKPANSGPAPQINMTSQAAAATTAPAFNPAQASQVQAQQTAQQQAPAFNQQAAAPAPTAAPAAVNGAAPAASGPAIPPWQK